MTGFLFAAFVAILAGLFGDKLMREGMPGGAYVAILTGLVGAWIGGYMPIFNTYGPSIDGLAVIPAILGAVVFVFCLGVSKSAVKQAK